MNSEKLVYTEKQAAALLQVSVDTLRRARRSRRIQFRLVGCRPRYTQEDLNAYLESSKVSARKLL
jgi:excisionase family DNA binding protein